MLFLKKNSTMPQFMIFPKKVMYNRNLSDYAKLVYALLLDRARVSMSNAEKGWEDDKGFIFIVYPLEDIAAVTGRCKTSVLTALKQLQNEKLIFRRHVGSGLASHIYITDISEVNEQKNDTGELRVAENCSREEQKTDIPDNRNPLPNNNKINNNDFINNKIYDIMPSEQKAPPQEKTENRYGRYKNVRLDSSEILNLQSRYDNPQKYVDELSEDIHINGDIYSDHFLEISMRAGMS